MRLIEMEKDQPSHEPVIRRTWYKTEKGYTCILEFRYWDEYGWQEDVISCVL